MAYDISVENRETLPAAIVRFTAPAGPVAQFLGPAYGEIGAYLHELGVEHDDRLVFARFLRLEPDMEVEAGFTVPNPIAPRGRVLPGILPGGEVASTVHVGPYATLPAATTALRAWLAVNGREPSGGPVEVYVDDPGAVPESELRTEVFYPLK
jgi:DNA gyrase inhibitor GyrI